MRSRDGQALSRPLCHPERSEGPLKPREELPCFAAILQAIGAPADSGYANSGWLVRARTFMIVVMVILYLRRAPKPVAAAPVRAAMRDSASCRVMGPVSSPSVPFPR